MAKSKATLCDLTEKLLVSNFIRWPNLQIILEAKSMDEFSWKKKCCLDFRYHSAKTVGKLQPLHTESFWNIIIQWTSHDNLTEKLVLAKPPQTEAAFFVKSQSVALDFAI